MSYADAMTKARKHIGKAGHCSLAYMVNEILCNCDDSVYIALSEQAEKADTGNIKAHEAACTKAGKIVIGLLHEYLAVNHGDEWLGVEADTRYDGFANDEQKEEWTRNNSEVTGDVAATAKRMAG